MVLEEAQLLLEEAVVPVVLPVIMQLLAVFQEELVALTEAEAAARVGAAV
jgi:hypothetical protein